MILSSVLRTIFPVRCVCCDKPASGDYPVCRKCLPLLIHPSDNPRRCPVCFMLKKNCFCHKRWLFSGFCTLFHYRGIAKDTVHRYKFKGRRDMAKGYSQLLVPALEERDMLSKTDIITYIPMTRSALFRRGYNQSELIARKISRKTGIECICLLKKCRKTKSQHILRRVNRSGNILGAFEPEEKYRDMIEGKNILIVDDVCTTGNTLNEAAKTLLIFGADNIMAAVCAATSRKPKSKKPPSTEKNMQSAEYNLPEAKKNIETD